MDGGFDRFGAIESMEGLGIGEEEKHAGGSVWRRACLVGATRGNNSKTGGRGPCGARLAACVGKKKRPTAGLDRGLCWIGMPFLVWCLVFRLMRSRASFDRSGWDERRRQGRQGKEEAQARREQCKVLLSPIPLFIVLHFPIFIVTFTFLGSSKHSPPTFHHQGITSSPPEYGSPSTSLSSTAPAAAAIGWQPPRCPQCLHQVASLHAALFCVCL